MATRRMHTEAERCCQRQLNKEGFIVLSAFMFEQLSKLTFNK